MKEAQPHKESDRMSTAIACFRDGGGLRLPPDLPPFPTRQSALIELSRPAAPIHDRRQEFPPELVTQALANEPFEDYPRAVWHARRLSGSSGAGGGGHERQAHSSGQGTEGLLRRLFPSLTAVPGIAFAAGRPARLPERRALEKALASSQAAGLPGQARELSDAFDGLIALRLLFGQSEGQGSGLFEQVVPVRYLPELLFAAPVWFVQTKAGAPPEARGAANPAVRYFCDLVRTDPFAHLFQIYNNRLRPFAEFNGPDLMPPSLTAFLGAVRGRFDYLVIATPYHGLAGAEWADPYWPPPYWPPQPDPFLFGFLRQVQELVFCLGRWSGTGIFPLLPELLAATAAHLQQNRELLAGYGNSPAFAWYKADTVLPPEIEVAGPALRPLKDFAFPKAALPRGWPERQRWKKQNHSLVRFAGRMLQHFEVGSLFPWLRGEGC